VVDLRQDAVGDDQALADEFVPQVLVERGDAVVVERGGAGAVDRHVLPGLAECLTVAHELTAHVAARVLGAPAFELVDRHHVGEVQHVDLLQLRRGAELGVITYSERSTNGTIAASPWPIPGVSTMIRSYPATLHARDDVPEPVRDLRIRRTRGQRPEEDGVAINAVHPDPVTQQRPASASPAWVDGEYRDPDLVLLVQPEAADQLVGQ